MRSWASWLKAKSTSQNVTSFWVLLIPMCLWSIYRSTPRGAWLPDDTSVPSQYQHTDQGQSSDPQPRPSQGPQVTQVFPSGMSPQPWLIQSDPSTGVACTNISLEATQEWKVLQIPWTWVGFPFSGGWGGLGGHIRQLGVIAESHLVGAWRWAVTGYSNGHSTQESKLTQSSDSRRENAAELMATLMSQEQVASRIYFLKFRRAHLWKDKINGHLSVSGRTSRGHHLLPAHPASSLPFL